MTKMKCTDAIEAIKESRLPVLDAADVTYFRAVGDGKSGLLTKAGLALDITDATLEVLSEDDGSQLIGYKSDRSGTVVRTTESKLQETVSVRDFAAIGDGTADDKDAFRAAVNSLQLIGGGKLIIPKGVYRMGDGAGTQIVITSAIQFIGEPGAVIFFDDDQTHAVDPNSTNRLFYLNNTSGVTFDGITFVSTALVSTAPATNAKQLIGGVWNKNVRFTNCGFFNLRHMAIALGGTSGAIVKGCTFENIGRDACRFTHSHNVTIGDNVFKNVSDDVVALHSSDSNYPAIPAPSGHTVTGNVFESCQGIRSLGAKGITISGNTFRRCTSHIVHIEQGWAGTEGNTPQFAINITGNTILDTLRINASGSTPIAMISVMSAPRDFTGLSNKPGVNAPRLAYNYLNNTDVAGSVNVAAESINISNNVIARTLSNVSNYSEWGYGEFFDHRNSGSFWSDPDITDATFGHHAIYIRGPADGVLISGNNITGLSVDCNAIRFDVAGTANTIDINDVLIQGNVIRDCPGRAVMANYTGSAAAATSLVVQNNMFDLDPFFRHPDHASDNTWTSIANVRALYLTAGMGMVFTGNTCKHMGQANSVGSTAGVYEGNYLWSDGAVAGNNATNKGVRVVDPNQINVIYNADPTSGSFGQVVTVPASAGSSAPATGRYVQGHVVKRTTPTIAGTAGAQYVNVGWVRITTGTGHTAGTDWSEMRVLTGT